jgi:hypothetical protein
MDPPPAKRWWRRPTVRVVAAALALLVGWVGLSLGRALTGPGNDSAAARTAEWARDHHLGFAVTGLEKLDYRLHKPKTGGTPPGGVPTAGAVPAARTVSPAKAVRARRSPPPIPHTRAPRPVRILAAGPPLPNEGRWQQVVTVKGEPAVRVAYVRPDAEHTSYLTGVMWLDPRLLAGRFHPGFQDPGGTWPTPDSITPALRPRVAAAFNGGFRLNGASRGGVWLAGHTARPLRTGAASLVLYRDGTADVGAWGSQVSLTPRVAAVRQNLDMLVDGAEVNPRCSEGNGPTWGATLGNRAYVWRSGFGVTRDGALVYVAGNAMSVCTLGRVLAAAGAVRGMELDINPEWTTGYYFTHEATGATVGHNLNPAQSHGPDRYFTVQSRDFFAFYTRP